MQADQAREILNGLIDEFIFENRELIADTDADDDKAVDKLKAAFLNS